MALPAAHPPPPHLTLAEAREIITNPARAMATPPLLRIDAWARLKADHAARQRRRQFHIPPPQGPNTPKDAA